MDSRPVVLVADDEPAITRLVARSLGAEGFRVATAGSGRDAIERVWDLNPDVLLLDVVMPDLSGLDVLDELRRSHPVRVILVSGLPPEEVENMLRGRRVTLLAKPLDHLLLEQALDRLN